MRLFVDSNYFCALYNPRDSQHRKAKKIAKALKQEKPSLIISNFIFLETVTIISQRVNKKTAIRLGKHLIDDEKIKIIHISPQLNKQTWEIFQKIKNKNVSFVDASILTLLSAEGIKNLLTFDSDHFKTLKRYFRFKILPSA